MFVCKKINNRLRTLAGQNPGKKTCFLGDFPWKVKLSVGERHQTIGRGVSFPYLHRPHDSGPIQWARGDAARP